VSLRAATSVTSSIRPRVVTPLVLALTLALAMSVMPSASAQPSSDAIRGDLERAQDRLEELEGHVNGVVDDFNEAREALDEVAAQRSETRAELEALGAQMDTLTAGVSEHVRRLHKLGPAMELSSVFIAGDAIEVGEKAGVLRRILDGQRLDLETLTATRAATDAAQQRLAAQEAEIEQRVEELEERREEAEATVARHQGELDALERQLAEAVSREEAEARRRAEEQARQEAAERARQQASSATSTSTTSTSPTSSGSSAGTAPSTAPAPRAGARVAVDAALSKLGSPYLWGATGPNSFDCSGLMVWAYAQAGISLPRTSRAQYAGTRRISRSELQPGDLVFAGNPVHHVGMYIGNGQIVHSPHSGATVSIRSMERRDLVGFGRPY
jgi:peptidoglycan DL-endopeptidase CwlO